MSSLAIAYSQELIQHPVRTKASTSATFNGLSEFIASYIAGDKDPRTGCYIGPRVGKMALYGSLVSGPLSHYLVDSVQRAFRKAKPGVATNIAQIVASNLLVNPILSIAFISWMSILAGARSLKEIKTRVKASLLTILKSQWITSPLLIAFAQKYVPKLAWTPTFSFFAFILSTYHNTSVRKRLAQDKKLE